jgi:hypothetical protein
MNRDRTCEERISEQQESRLSHISELLSAAQGDFECLSKDEIESLEIGDPVYGEDEELENEYELEEAAGERIYELPLSVDTKHTERILLSTGGPGDWIDVDFDRDGDVVGASYHFQDWFDHAERELHGDELRIAEEFAERLGVCEAVRERLHGAR